MRRLEVEADQERIPIVGPVVGELLFILARAMGARQILELGTATGYSAICLAQAVAPDVWPSDHPGSRSSHGPAGRKIILPRPACRTG